MNYYDIFDSDFGPFIIAVDEDGAVIATAFGGPEWLREFGLEPATMTRDSQRVAHVRSQLEEYFRGERESFDLTLAPSSTPYRERVWKALQEIPIGKTRSYGEMAKELGSAPRAVGGAIAANRLCPIIPCQRAIGSDGSLTGFAYGVELKKRLLELEARVAAKTPVTV